VTLHEEDEYLELLEKFSESDDLKKLLDLHTQKRLNDAACIEEQQGNAIIIYREVAGLQTLRHYIFQERKQFLEWKKSILNARKANREEE